jgi:hypothetical protein
VIDAPLKIQLLPAKKTATGICESLLLKIEAHKESLDEEIQKMGKKASLRYKASQDGFNQQFFWEKCLGQKETILLVQTDKNSVIGSYFPDQWEDTTGMKDSYGNSDYKDITSGSPFLFYWVNDEIKIIRHRDDKIPFMASRKDWLMEFGYGLLINTDKNKES